jgi:ketosteroid isomerase-like protein
VAKVLFQYFRLFCFCGDVFQFHFMKKLSVFLLACLMMFGCRPKQRSNIELEKTEAAKLEIREADEAFSAMSKSKGLRTAFFEFIDSNGVILRPNTLPLAGGDAMDFITQSNDTSLTMTWQPKEVMVAASGELGYSYGVYAVQQKGEDSVTYGSYVTIWKRQPNGKWKFILQSGNEGVE